MIALLDGDILKYEVGFAAEAGYKLKLQEEGHSIHDDVFYVPSFDYVENILNQRIQYILQQTEADDFQLYLTEGKTFREDVASTKPYKGTRKDKKPWHYKNLSVYMKDVLDATIVTGIEADDAMAIDHTDNPDTTIICSRDKDLRQVPGKSYSWELGKQAAFGPIDVSPLGWIQLSNDRKKLIGCGYKFFASQVLTGDTVDNIPGLRKCGPVAAFNMLEKCMSEEECEDVLKENYNDEDYLMEQAQLCWIVRRYNSDGSPQIWKEGLYV